VRCLVPVERDDEVRLLSRLASNASAVGAPRVAAITGEAGTGKLRLAQRVRRLAAGAVDGRDVRVTRTAAGLSPAGAGRPLALIVDDAHLVEPPAVARLPEHTGALLVLATFRLGATVGQRGDSSARVSSRAGGGSTSSSAATFSTTVHGSRSPLASTSSAQNGLPPLRR